MVKHGTGLVMLAHNSAYPMNLVGLGANSMLAERKLWHGPQHGRLQTLRGCHSLRAQEAVAEVTYHTGTASPEPPLIQAIGPANSEAAEFMLNDPTNETLQWSKAKVGCGVTLAGAGQFLRFHTGISRDRPLMRPNTLHFGKYFPEFSGGQSDDQVLPNANRLGPRPASCSRHDIYRSWPSFKSSGHYEGPLPQRCGHRH
jgi:hypothetical protein